MTHRSTPVRILAVVLVMTALGILGACSNDDGDSAMRADSAGSGGDGGQTGGGAGGDAYNRVAVSSDDVGFAQGEEGVAVGAPQQTIEAPTLDSQVIKTGYLQIDIPKDKVNEAMGDATVLASRFGGFVVASSVQETGGTVTIRVPSARFEETLTAIGDLGEVTGQEISGEDVAATVIDLEARLRHATAQEAVMVRLMDSATTVEDTIRVQRELEGIQLQIEKLRGQLRYLDDQTSFSTISMSFTELGAPVPNEPTAIARAWDVAVQTVEAIASGTMIGLAFAVPVTMVLALLYLVLRPVIRRVKADAAGWSEAP